MLKRLSIIILLLFSIFIQDFSLTQAMTPDEYQENIAAQETISEKQKAYDDAQKKAKENADNIRKENQSKIDDATQNANEKQRIADEAATNYEQSGSEKDRIESQKAQENAYKAEVEAIALQNEVNNSVDQALSASDPQLHDLNQAKADYGNDKENLEGNKGLEEEALAKYKEELQKSPGCEINSACGDAKREYEKAKEATAKSAATYSAGKESDGDIKDTGFMIKVNNLTPGMQVGEGKKIEDTANILFAEVIQKMMILLGSAALLFMTIGAGYIIMHHGQDELLSKGKSIFMSGIYALVVALSSYYIVAMFRYVLYQGN